ncbi:uncharacterized protein LOC129891107 isoform X1 [Solanum dulcamara]|uniref:uncharacterized protein LOC129891107 isoform X1 n=1 Tax=Solanum dulcamara TaxID=45834 RepID=UPI002486061D|nr:uncharacterized protein LOC129891107 isoform X1 [Solanum dulcamara]
MLDGILTRGFSSKCKSLVKATRTRIEVVRRRAESKQRFLKEDLAKLLHNGLDINAYGRTEEFLLGQNLLSCYDFVEQSCEYIVKQLSYMQKLRDCPENCREAVASLMFAAARFSDLPEIRELRDLFQERYGNSLECFVNQKFVEKLSSRPPAVEKRIQQLQDIAVEFSIRWDSMGFQKRMAFARAQPNRSGPSHASAGNHILPNGKDGGSKADKLDIALGERHKGLNDQHNIQNGRESIVLKKEQLDLHSSEGKESSKDRNKHLTKQEASYSMARKHDILFEKEEEQTRIRNKAVLEKDDNSIRIAKSGSSSHGQRLEGFDNKFTRHNENHGQILTGRAQDPLSCARSETAPSRGLPFRNEYVSSARDTAIEKNTVNSTRMVQQEVGNRLMISYPNFSLPPPYTKSKQKAIPPPYVKPNDSKERALKGSKQSASEFDGHFRSLSPCNRVETIKINKESDLPDHVARNIKPTRTNSHGHDKEFSHKDVILPKPRSVRRKHHKSATNHGEVDKSEDARAVKRSSSSRRREHSRKGLQILFEDERHRKDEEERMIDKLLLHYSKRPSKCDLKNLRKKAHALTTPDTGEFSNNQTNRDQDKKESDMVLFPKRSISFPHEQAAPSKATHVFARANSFQPDNQACHVHPKLPDYDDLTARFASLRGR